MARCWLALALLLWVWLHETMPGRIAERIGRTAVEKLIEARKLHGLSRRRVAAALGCSPTTLKFWESKRRRPSRISAHWLLAFGSKLNREGSGAINEFLGEHRF
jgi:transcriptional regulator with XRE-family HTH domain